MKPARFRRNEKTFDELFAWERAIILAQMVGERSLGFSQANHLQVEIYDVSQKFLNKDQHDLTLAENSRKDPKCLEKYAISRILWKRTIDRDIFIQ